MPETAQRDTDATEEALSGLVVGVGHAIRFAWRTRLEMTLGAIVAVTALVVADEPLAVQLAGATLLIVSASCLWPWLGPALAKSRVRRAWIDATGGDYRIKAIRIVPAGEVLTVTIPRGSTAGALQRRADELADTMRVIGVRPVRTEGGRADVLIYRRDPFDHAPPLPWPNRDAEHLSVWQPMPFARDEAGEEVCIESMGGHVLISGVTGSGKSVGLHLFTATRALDPTAHLYLLDNKAVELAPWLRCAHVFAQDDMRDAIQALHGIQRLMQERFNAMRAEQPPRRQVSPGDDTHHVIIEELGYYLNHPNRKQRSDFLAALLDILQRGRAAGFQVIATMQRPDAQSISTAARSQFSYRILFRTVDAETTRMVLGNFEGCDAHLIPERGYEGVGFVGGDRRPRRIRSYLLTDEDIAALADRAGAARLDADLDLLLGEPEPEPPTEDPSPTPPPAGAGDSRTRSVWEALPRDAAQAVSYEDLERQLGGRHRWRKDLQRLRDSGAVVAYRGQGHGGPWRFHRAPDGNPELGEPSP